MKYAIITHFTRPDQTKDQMIENVGNYYQQFAIESLYHYMGLQKKDIVALSSGELQYYCGEPLIVPINFMMADMSGGSYVTEGKTFAFSNDVIPVFLGLSVKNTCWEWTEERLTYFKRYEPIGCRDYYTYDQLTKRGVKAYLAGCLTATLSLRKSEGAYDRVYFVDAPSFLEDRIPAEIKTGAYYKYHAVNFTEEEFYDTSYIQTYARNLLNEYRNHAKLIVTSRLHCALPCMAMGIPVIAVKEYFGYPFDLQKIFLPFYTYQNISEIDWQTQAPNIEAYKRIALDCAATRLRGDTVAAREAIERLHAQYAPLYASGYTEEKLELDYFQTEFKRRFSPNAAFDYALWGITEDAERIYRFISESCPNARLVKTIDTFRDVRFHEIETERPEVLEKDKSLMVFATTLNVSIYAKEYFNRIGKEPETYLCVSEGVLGEKK